MGGSVLSGATRASLRVAGRGPPALPEHTPSNSARIGTPPAESVARRAGSRERARSPPGRPRSRSYAPVCSLERLPHVRLQVRDRRLQGPRARHEDRIDADRPPGSERAVRLAQSSACSIAPHRASDLAAHDEPCPPGAWPRHPEKHKGTPLLSSPRLEYRLNVLGLPEASGAGEAERCDRSAHPHALRR